MTTVTGSYILDQNIRGQGDCGSQYT